MIISRLRVENFKKFRRPFEINDLAPGINLFVAPNESGKSTLTEAIRAAFFERSRSASVDHLRPWGDATAAPTVELEFEWNEVKYQISKSFLARKRCDLMIGTQSLDGAQAEDYLAELMGFQYPGRGSSNPEHMGIPGLLWIRQGGSHELNQFVGYAGDHLRQALGGSVGDLTLGSGDQLIATLEDERSKLVTASNASPRGEYQVSLRRKAELGERLDFLKDQIDTYREGVDRLGRLRAEHAEDESNKPWVALRAQHDLAAAQFRQAMGLKDACTQAEQQVKQGKMQLTALQSQVQGFANDADQLHMRQTRLNNASTDLEAKQSGLKNAQDRLSLAQGDFASAQQRLTLSRIVAQRQGISQTLEGLQSQLSTLQSNLGRAQGLQAQVMDLNTRAQATRVDKVELKKLVKLQDETTALRNRLDAVSTTLEFDLTPNASVRVEGKPVEAKARINLIGQTQINLGDWGCLTVLPGGVDLAILNGQLLEKQTTLSQWLTQLRADSVAQLQERQSQFEALSAQLESTKELLAVLAPVGVSELQTQERSTLHQIEQLRMQFAGFPEIPVDETLPLAEAERLESNARAGLESASEILQKTQLEAATSKATRDAAHEEYAVLFEKVSAPNYEEIKTQARKDLDETLAAQVKLESDWRELLKKVGELNLAVLEQDVNRLLSSTQQAEQNYQQRLQQISALDAELQTRGALGQEEELATLQHEFGLVQRRATEFERRVKALNLLLELLRSKRQELALKLQAPLQKHLQHYLAILWPGTEVELAEDLSIEKIQRVSTTGAEVGNYEEFSIGAREQMGVVARLAYADLLKEANRPTLLILDDALVNSDKTRLGQMKRVLYDAATRHQILLFSCHPEDWSDLGVPRREF